MSVVFNSIVADGSTRWRALFFFFFFFFFSWGCVWPSLRRELARNIFVENVISVTTRELYQIIHKKKVRKKGYCSGNIIICLQQAESPAAGGGERERGKGAYGVKTNRDEERGNVLWWVGENFAKKNENFENFISGIDNKGFRFFFYFGLCVWPFSSQRLTKQERTRPSFAKFTSGVLPPRKKIGKVTSPYWKLIRTHFFTCLSIFSLSRSRPPIVKFSLHGALFY